MSDPKRMIEMEEGLGAALLASAERDAPSSMAKSRAARALGIGVAASVGMAIGAGVAQGAGKGAGVSATAAATKGSIFAGLSVSKWILVAALGGGTTLAASYGIEASQERPGHRAVSTPALPVPAIRAVQVQPEASASTSLPEQVEADEASSEVIESDRQEIKPARAAVPKGSKTQGKSPAASVGITDELALIEQARRQTGLASLETLAVYRSRFPQGVLRPEALALEIVLRRSLGQGQEADQLMQQFQSRYPRSPLLEGLVLPAVEAP